MLFFHKYIKNPYKLFENRITIMILIISNNAQLFSLVIDVFLVSAFISSISIIIMKQLMRVLPM